MTNMTPQEIYCKRMYNCTVNLLPTTDTAPALLTT